MNVRQNSKYANTYARELEDLTKSLENAYVSDGLTSDLANKYSTQVAMIKNCNVDEIKVIVEAGQFSNMNEAVSNLLIVALMQLANNVPYNISNAIDQISDIIIGVVIIITIKK